MDCFAPVVKLFDMKTKCVKIFVNYKKQVHGPCHFKVLYFRVLFVPYEKLIFRVAELSTILRFSEM